MKHVPQRTCIVCREQKDKNELVRIVKNSDGVISIDRSGKADGRGAYVCKSEECRQALVKKRVLNRTFKTQIDAQVYDRLAAELSEVE